MYSITAIALYLTLAAVVLYALYWVIRKAVAGGIRDSRADAHMPSGETRTDRP